MTGALVARLAAVLRGAVPAPEEEAAELAAAAGEGAAPGASVEAAALALAARRAAGEPLAHLLGRVRFMGLALIAGPGALVPREETEQLGRAAVEWLFARAPGGAGLRLLDLGCGSGNLACGVAHRLPALRAVASDLTDGAVLLARRNVSALGLSGRIEVVQGDLFAALGGLGLERGFDLIVCNPPYLSTGRLARDRAGLLAYEPREAFDGGPYGLSIHQRVIRGAPRFLRPGGALAVEIGLGQEEQVRQLFLRSGAFALPAPRDGDRGDARVLLAHCTA